MAWRDQLRPASFRGVPFFVSLVDGEHGRRYATHEYPGRDDPFLEDMGRLARIRSIDAHVLEPDHIAKTKALIDACETLGPGALVHPWFGEFNVVCTRCVQTFRAADAGMATFALSFSDAGDARYPDASTNAISSVDFGSLELNSASVDELGDTFDVVGFPDYIATSAAETLKDFGGTIRTALGPVATGIAAAASWQQGISSLIIEAANLVRAPSQMAGQVLAALDFGNVIGNLALSQALFTGAQSALGIFTGETPLPSWRAYVPLMNWHPENDGTSGTTPARVQQVTNREIFGTFARRAAASQAARAAVRETFPTYEEALAARDVIAEALDTETATANDTVYQQSVLLRAAVVNAVSEAAPILPRLVEYRPQATISALALANTIYGDTPAEVAERADEVVARNLVRHPLFVPGGGPLRIRTR